jgi:hypothetical protein
MQYLFGPRVAAQHAQRNGEQARRSQTVQFFEGLTIPASHGVHQVT